MAQKNSKSSGKGGTSHWFILILLALAQFMVVLDVSIVNVALPSIQKAFSMPNTSLQWIVTAYSLAFGGFLLLGGRTADLFGRRKTFILGITGFTLASLLSGLSQSGGMIITARILQGLSGAFMSPAALSIVLVIYKEGKERNVALSVWGAVAAGGAAVGVLLGGILTQYLNWRWNFFINVPVGVLVVLTAFWILPKHESESEHRNFDAIGAFLVTGGLMALVYGLVKAPTDGWTSRHAITYFTISIVSLTLFVINESRAKHPLLPLRIFRNRNLVGADLAQLILAAGIFSVFFFLTLYMQEILGYSPVRTGVNFLIIPIIIGITAANVPRIIAKIGYKPILVVAPLLVSTGLFMLSHIPVNGDFWHNVAPGMMVFALGMGATFVSVTIAATSGVSKQESGLSSGLLTTAQQIGGAIGLAILTGLVTSSTTRYIANLHTTVTPQITAAASVHGFQKGFLFASSFGIIASLIALFVIKPTPVKQPTADHM
jgi:EmrB/QacA subfamily drug resistance transporter